jgi:ribosomal-protein-alanine N-acetyltransferase
VLARRITDARRVWREDRGYALLVLPRDVPDGTCIIGRVAFNAIVRGAFHNAYLGYWMDVDRLGRGLMTEAVSAAVTWAFSEVGLHRVQAAVMATNLPSLRVLEKLRFRREGVALRYLQIAGRWEDHILHAVTREEWTA